MHAFRRGLTYSSSSSSAARTAANAVANRVAPTGLEAEEWIATDVEDSGAVFSEPLTIDELNHARSSLESALTQAHDDTHDPPEDSQLAPAGFDGGAIAVAGMGHSSTADAYDPDLQMRMIDQRRVGSGVQEILDAAFTVAQHEPVKNAVISVLQQSPDARAALQRAFAANGLSISLAPMVQPALPPAAAAIQTAPPKIQDITDEELEHEKTASSDLDGFIRAVLGTLEKFGDNVKGILRSFVARWKRRFGRLFNPGAMNEKDDDGEPQSGPAFLLDAIATTATLLVIVALVGRVRMR